MEEEEEEQEDTKDLPPSHRHQVHTAWVTLSCLLSWATNPHVGETAVDGLATGAEILRQVPAKQEQLLAYELAFAAPVAVEVVMIPNSDLAFPNLAR